MTNENELREPEFQLFHDYWNELRGDDFVPDKANFDPTKVSSLMAIMSVIQWFPPDVLHLRLMGTNIVDQTHIETTGSNLLDVMYEPQRQLVADLSQALFAQPAIGLAKTKRCFESGKTVEVQFAFFPFRDVTGEIDIAIGVHKADADAHKLIAPYDPLLYALLTEYRYMNIGNGIPNLSYTSET